MASPQPENATPGQGPDLKAKLDEASSRSRQPQHNEDTSEATGGSIVDKGLFPCSYLVYRASLTGTPVSQYIPAVKKIVGEREESEPRAETPPKNEGPPDRPYDDPKIGQFLRDQHKSMPIDKLDE
jgi:hypothetical protein